jgi:integrase
MPADLAFMKHTIRRAEIYARSEVEAILSAPRQPRDRAFLMTIYACGLRLAEARHLKTTDIDRARMQLRVRKGKGGKERVLPLSNRLLKELVDYWRAQRQGKWGHDIPWLFLGYRAEPICTTSGQNIFYRAVKKDFPQQTKRQRVASSHQRGSRSACPPDPPAFCRRYSA